MWLSMVTSEARRRASWSVRASHDLSRVSVSCDEANLVSVAGLLPAAALAQKVGLAGLVEQRVRLARHGANSGTKALSVVGSMLTGGDSIDDVALLGSGATSEVFDQLRAPSTIGSWLLARLWAAGAGPVDPAGPLTFDLDSTICPVYGRAKQGAGFGYTKVCGYHPQLATLPETGQVIFSRLRGGPAGAARGAKSFLTETISRLRHAGATHRRDGVRRGRIVRPARRVRGRAPEATTGAAPTTLRWERSGSAARRPG